MYDATATATASGLSFAFLILVRLAPKRDRYKPRQADSQPPPVLNGGRDRKYEKRVKARGFKDTYMLNTLTAAKGVAHVFLYFSMVGASESTDRRQESVSFKADRSSNETHPQTFQ